MDERISRRNFLRGVGVSAVAGTVAKVAAAAQSVESLDDQKPIGPEPAKLVLQVNGNEQELEVEPRVTLLDVLRNRLQLTGAKEVCDRATCGACTVLVNGRPVYSCMKLAVEMQGQDITTIEGLGGPNDLTPIQRAFIECDAMMCGFCTPGFVMSLTALFRVNQNPSLEQIKKACSGNLCRCGTYPHIFEAARRNAVTAVNLRNAVYSGSTENAGNGEDDSLFSESSSPNYLVKRSVNPENHVTTVPVVDGVTGAP